MLGCLMAFLARRDQSHTQCKILPREKGSADIVGTFFLLPTRIPHKNGPRVDSHAGKMDIPRRSPSFDLHEKSLTKCELNGENEQEGKNPEKEGVTNHPSNQLIEAKKNRPSQIFITCKYWGIWGRASPLSFFGELITRNVRNAPGCAR